jgi:photosystem II stability/assembly factor-like uncharacterized protein
LAITCLPAQKLDTKLLQGMKARNIGPGGMSGRVTAIDVDLSNPNIIYAGTASGGLWKSEGGGTDWKPIFDKEKVASIGAIAINQKNPNEIWVGTGEGNPRNSQSSGAGIYHSLDAGKTWTLKGLEATRNIHRIIIHKDNPNIIYAGAIGSAWGDSKDRGVYRSKDSGKTWEQILYINERTGAADFDVDPNNPDKMFVNMWEYRRWPWFFKSGGKGSGLHVTLDGGDTWKRLDDKNGLPKGELGKIGIAIAPNKPNVVYALVESKKNALYRSDDGGNTFKKTAEKNIGSRPFYYWDLAVDPNNENRVYSIASSVRISEDGGKNFKTLLGFDKVHVDHHAWWIHPEDSKFMISGNDGGLYLTRDQGKSWKFAENLPVAQFYHITVDDNIPYNVMGGMQDNGTWRGPAYTWRNGGIRNDYWQEIGFGDGFDVVVEQDNSRYVYCLWQGGNLFRMDLETGGQEWMKPFHPDGEFLRFNWNAGIEQDPLNEGTIYFGSQYLHKSTDRGRSWEIISPDLTTNDPEKQKQAESGGLTYDVTGAENHTSIISIAASPIKKGLIWVGTDDGNLQITQDGGKNWTNVIDKLQGVPKGSWIPQVHASAFNAGEAYVVINNYRRDDWTPFLFRTKDFGATWENLTKDKDIWGYCLSWVQDPIEPKLQFLGTEFGLYISIDEGKNWTKWTNGYPNNVSTIDMQIQEREQDLVIGTFGRAAYVLDDIRPLRTLAQQGLKILEQDLKVYPIPATYLANYNEASGTRFAGDAIYAGENRPYGAMVSFSVKKEEAKKEEKAAAKKADATKKAAKKEAKVRVVDSKGNTIRNFKVAKIKDGLNRFHWNLRRDGIRFPTQPKPKKKDADIPAGRFVIPGVYKIIVSYGEHRDSQLVTVHADPRIDVKSHKIKEHYAAQDKFMNHLQALTETMDNLRAAKAKIKSVSGMVEEQVEAKEAKEGFSKQSTAITKEIDSLLFLVMPNEKIQGFYFNPDMLSTKIGQAGTYFDSSFGGNNPAYAAPSPTTLLAAKTIQKEIVEYIDIVNNFFANNWTNFQKEVDNLDLSILKEVKKVKVE